MNRTLGLLLNNVTPGQTIAKNMVWLTVSNVGGRLVRSLIIIYAARVLGAGPWGVFSYAITLTAFFMLLTDFGINGLLTRETTKLRHDLPALHKVLSTAFIIKMCLLAITLPLIIFLGPHFTNIDEVQKILPLVGLILIFDTLRDFGFSLFRAYEQMEREAALSIFTNACIVVFGVIFLSRASGVTSFTYAYVIGSGIGTVATFWSLGAKFPELFRNFSKKLVRPLLTSAWPFMLAGLLGALMVNTDVLMIGWLRTAEEVGFYAAAQRILLLLYVIPGTLSISSFPLLSRLAAAGDAKRERHVLERTLAFSFLFGLPIMAGGIALGPQLLSLIFGTSFVPATVATQILLLTVPLQFIGIILSNAAFAHDAQKKLITYTAIGGTLNVALNVILIRQWGIEGCAIATLVSQIASVGYLWHTLDRRVISFSIMPHVRKIAGASLVIGIGAYLLRITGLHPATIVALSVPCYGLLLILMKEDLIGDALGIARRIVRG